MKGVKIKYNSKLKRYSECRIQYYVTFTENHENYGFNVMSLTNTAKVAKIWPKKVHIHFLRIFSQILNGHMTIFGQVWYCVILGQNPRF